MSTALDLDLATLVGELEELACEHRAHKFGHKDGPATHYASYHCPDCLRTVSCIAVCADWVAAVLGNEWGICTCGSLALLGERNTILGPVNGRAS